jgi:hypothetical protein
MTAQEIQDALAEPFEPGEVKFKPAVVKGNRAMALAYVDARVIMDRLDDVVGVAGWQDSYEYLPDGSALCKLSLKIEGEWITKCDIGGQSEQTDEGDRHKAACSDALKRTAVKFGVARFLYRLPSQWCDYNPDTKQFAVAPRLPEWVVTPAPPNAAARAAGVKRSPVQKKLTDEETKTYHFWVGKIEAEVTKLDECNAACRQMEELKLPKGLLKTKLWEFVCSHAEQQGWTWLSTSRKFVYAEKETA